MLYLIFEQLCTTREQNKEKYKPRRLFAERKARISMPKLGRFFKAWKIKSSASSSNLCASKTNSPK